MTMARTIFKSVLAGAIALATLAGCAIDKEQDVRAQVDAWIDIGDTMHFTSQMGCTAGVFRLSSIEVKSPAPHAVTIREGLSLLKQVGVASFQTPDLSPSDISAQINSVDMGVGTGILTSGLGGRECLEGDWRAAYTAALETKGGILIFKRDGNALVVVDRKTQRVYFARGDV
ncbi:MAG: hypothetical protein ACRBBS_17575 [Thalassovita sp.]